MNGLPGHQRPAHGHPAPDFDVLTVQEEDRKSHGTYCESLSERGDYLKHLLKKCMIFEVILRAGDYLEDGYGEKENTAGEWRQDSR